MPLRPILTQEIQFTIFQNDEVVKDCLIGNNEKKQGEGNHAKNWTVVHAVANTSRFAELANYDLTRVLLSSHFL